jgi:hypothetical protein
LHFQVWLDTGFPTSGTFTSSSKDSNPAAGFTANWGTISWTAQAPSGTAVGFQAAGSNNVGGPFIFVGPDGTTSTFFANGASLAQFNGNRYVKYQATLNGGGTLTPTLNDVTVCFANQAPATSLAVSSAFGSYGGTATLSATLSSLGTAVSGKTIAFSLNGVSVGSTNTDGSGIATLAGASLAGIVAGSYPGGVVATFAGDGGYAATSGSADLTVDPQDASSSVKVTRGGYVLNLATGRYVQTVTLTNTSASAVTGPLSLVLDSLSSNATLYNATGTTSSLAPPMSPYINANVSSLAPGQSVSVQLQFTNPSRTTITYNTRVLAGPGGR